MLRGYTTTYFVAEPPSVYGTYSPNTPVTVWKSTLVPPSAGSVENSCEGRKYGLMLRSPAAPASPMPTPVSQMPKICFGAPEVAMVPAVVASQRSVFAYLRRPADSQRGRDRVFVRAGETMAFGDAFF